MKTPLNLPSTSSPAPAVNSEHELSSPDLTSSHVVRPVRPHPLPARAAPTPVAVRVSQAQAEGDERPHCDRRHLTGRQPAPGADGLGQHVDARGIQEGASAEQQAQGDGQRVVEGGQAAQCAVHKQRATQGHTLITKTTKKSKCQNNNNKKRNLVLVLNTGGNHRR